jgi:hypothetical protein
MNQDTYTRIIRFCAEECKRQGSGELSVADMFDAWQFAQERFKDQSDPKVLSVAFISALGKMVEPAKNTYPRGYATKDGFRTVPVSIGGNTVPVCDFNRVLGVLCSSNLTPEEFYREFEKIHPFIDGNGRVGAILYNALLDRLENPIATPDVEEKTFFETLGVHPKHCTISKLK